MLRDANMGWAVVVLMLLGLAAGPGAASWTTSGKPASSTPPAATEPASAAPPEAAQKPALSDREAQVIALLSEAMHIPPAPTLAELARSGAGTRHISTLVVSVPDPRQSLVSFYFDQVVETLVNAAEALGLAKDRYLFPWRPPGNTPGVKAPERYTGPGVMLFHSAAAQAGGALEDEWLVMLLVGESPVLGARGADLDEALRWAAALETDNAAPLHVLGPFFSGAAKSLASALSRRREVGPPTMARVITGTATAASIGAMFSAPEVSFARTVPLDGELLEFLVCEIAQRHAPRQPRIAMLAEIGTVFGSGLQARDGAQARAAETAAMAVSAEPSSNDAAEPHRNCSDLKVSTFRFPLHIAKLRAARERDPKQGDDTVATLRRTLELRLDREEDAIADTPAVFSALTAHESELELRQLLQRICADQTEYLVLAATDPVDTVFLAQESRKYCPGMALATLGADVLFTHPDLRAAFSGALVASPYPLLFETQALTSWRQTTPFGSDVAQGFYNAALALLSESVPGMRERPVPLLRYRSVQEECPSGVSCPAYGPQLWLTMIANNAYWPLARATAWRSLPQAYRPPDGASRREAGARTPRAHRLRPTGLALAAAGLVLLFASLHLGRTLAGAVRARRQARDLQRRAALAVAGVQNGSDRRPSERTPKDPAAHDLTPNDLARLRYTLCVHLALASLIYLVLPTALAITAPDRTLARVAIAYAVMIAVGLVLAALCSAGATLRRALPLAKPMARAFWSWRRERPRRPWSDEQRALAVQALATFFNVLVLSWVGCACVRWVSSWQALGSTPQLHSLARSVDPLGMSPLLPLFYLAVGLYLWGASGLRRVAAQQRFTTRSPFPPDIEGETLHGLTRKLQGIWHGSQFVAELWTLGALAVPALYFWQRLLPTFEGHAYDCLLRTGFIVLYGSVAFACVKFTLTWRLLSRFLRQLAAQPMIDAYDRVALKVQSSFGLQFSARVPDAREFETSAYNCQLLATLASQIGAAGQPQSGLLSATATDLEAASSQLQANVALDSDREGASAGDASGSGRASSDSCHPQHAHDVLVESAPGLGGVSSDLRSLVVRPTQPPGSPSGGAGDGASGGLARVQDRRHQHLLTSDELQVQTHATFFEASAKLFAVLRTLWHARVRNPLTREVCGRPDLAELLPGGKHSTLPTAAWFMGAVSQDVYLWTRMAEDFVALRVVTFIHHILHQLRSLLIFALNGAVALVLLVASYPLQPSRFVTVFAWLLMLLVIAGGLASILFMEKNELLSRLGNSGPGRLSLSVPFVGQMIMYVALPTAVVVASVFPEVSELLFAWLAPLARLLP
jgi:hypothetical protein